MSTTAERLRAVREACREFLLLWAVDRALDRPGVAARIWADVRAAGTDPFGRRSLQGPGRIADE